MSENKRVSDRQYAANMARKYFSGAIPKSVALDNFPDYSFDRELRELYERINNRPRRSWLFGVSESKYEKFIEETYKLIDTLEANSI